MPETGSVLGKSGSIAFYHYAGSEPLRGTVLCLHGGPGGDHRGNNGIFDEIAQACCPMGYHVLQFDMFGAGRSSGRPEQITLSTQLNDFRAMLQYARDKLPHPIHVAGESMGATIAALDWQADVASYILLWPAFDLHDTDLRPYFSGKWAAVLEREGFLDDNGTIVGRAFIDEIRSLDAGPCFALPTTPCLLVHGKRDSAVPFQQSLEAVKRATGPCVLFAHPEGDHGLQTKEQRAFTMMAYTAWLARQ
jgi:uncharacterized protein